MSNAASLPLDRLLACPHCDCVQRAPEVPISQQVRCVRCHTYLYRGHDGQFQGSLALLLTAILLLLITHTAPFLALDVSGRSTEMTLISACWAMWQSGQWPAALIVAFTSVLVPLLELFGLLWIVMPLVVPSWRMPSARIYRWVLNLRQWAMLEVYLISLLVALFKLQHMASVIIGPAFYAFGALSLVLAATFVRLDRRAIWLRCRWWNGQA